MQDPYYYYPHNLYQPTLNPQNHSKQNNSSIHQDNFQAQNNIPPVPNEFPKRDNSQIPSSTEFLGYHNDQIHHYIPYTNQPRNDLEKRLNHLSYQLAYLIQQNNHLLRYLQKQPEQSQTVSTPSGGTVIVRM